MITRKTFMFWWHLVCVTWHAALNHGERVEVHLAHALIAVADAISSMSARLSVTVLVRAIGAHGLTHATNAGGDVRDELRKAIRVLDEAEEHERLKKEWKSG